LFFLFFFFFFFFFSVTLNFIVFIDLLKTLQDTYRLMYSGES